MSEKEKQGKGDDGGVLTTAFRAGLGAAQSMQQTAIEIPLKIMQDFGVAPEKMAELRAKSHELIGGLYHMIDDTAVKTGLVKPQADAAEKKKADAAEEKKGDAPEKKKGDAPEKKKAAKD